MAKKRRRDGDPYEDFDYYHELAMVGGTGSVTTISEVPRKRRKKIKRRPIGYTADIDAEEDAE